MADPWTQKTLKEAPNPGVDNRQQPQQAAASHVGPNIAPELPTVTAATLAALQEFTCHKSARHEVQLLPGSIMPCPGSCMCQGVPHEGMVCCYLLPLQNVA